MTQRATQEGADGHVKNEGVNAVTALLRLLANTDYRSGTYPSCSVVTNRPREDGSSEDGREHCAGNAINRMC